MEKWSHYTLKERQAVPCPVDEWAREQDDMASRRVAETVIGDTEVLTAFVGIDMSLGTSARPVVFETTVFEDGEMIGHRRYATWEEAEAGHQDTCARLQAKRGDS